MAHQICPYLCVRGAGAAIDFYVDAFGAVEKLRLTEPGGRIGHAELDIGGALLMMSDEYPELGIQGPRDEELPPVTIYLHVDDADAVIARAADAGARVERSVEDQFYGERSGVVIDPFGHRWYIAHTIGEMSGEEMQRRYTALFQQEA